MAGLRTAIDRQAAVALLGPRQVGKTTLALALAEERKCVYLDMEDSHDRAKLEDAKTFLAPLADRLVIIDEIHRAPNLFPVLRGLIDSGRREGRRTGRFLLLGSASLELLRQSGETLAGRISYLEMGPLRVDEIPATEVESLWVRGGFPESYVAVDEVASRSWREDFIRTYLERDIPQLGPRIPSETLRRLWSMLAHAQGGLHHAARLAEGLEVSGQTIGRYTDLLVDLLLVRRLLPVGGKFAKRLVKSPKVYLRDSGILHALLNIANRDELFAHPILGPSWEGFVIENLIALAPERTTPGFYRTSAGAEVDLVLDFPGGKRWAIEIKRSVSAVPTRGFHLACEDLQPDRRFLVRAGVGRHPLSGGGESIGLPEIVEDLKNPKSQSGSRS